MLEKTIGKYISWAVLFVSGIMVYAVIWNWRMFSVALAFTGLLAVALGVIADSYGERSGDLTTPITEPEQEKRAFIVARK